MSFRVTFRDKTSVLIEDDRGEKLKALKLAPNPPKDIELNDDVVQMSDIVSIRKAFEQQPLEPEKQIAATGKVCRGQYSIQKEINEIIKSEEGWDKKIKDDKYREKIRQTLRAQKGVMWCDYKTKECACD